MSDDKPSYDIFTTPVGELVYPWLTRADTRYEPDGIFQTKLLLPFEGAQELIAKLEGSLGNFIGTLDLKQQKKYVPATVFEQEMDDDAIETGNVLFRFKLKNMSC